MEIKDFFSTMATKIAKQNNESYKDLLEMEGIINDEVANDLISNLMSLEHAKSKLKSSMKAEVMNGIDAKLSQIVESLGLSIEFENGTDSFQKIDKFKDYVKEALERKPDKSNDDSKLAKQYKDELIAERQAHTVTKENAIREKAQLVADNDLRYMQHAKINGLRGKNWANKNVSEDNWIKVSNQIISDALQKVGAIEVLNEGKLSLMLASDPTSPYFDDKGVTVSHDDFVNKILVENKLLAVTETPKVDNQLFAPTMPLNPVNMNGNGDPLAMKQRNRMNEAVNKTFAEWANKS